MRVEHRILSASPNPKGPTMRRHGFTMIELMVVTGIIAILIGLVTFGVNKMVEANATKAALTTVSSAMTTGRAYATRGIETGQVFDQTQYQGTALLFTPTEIRILRHVTRKRDGTRMEDDSGSALPRDVTAYREIRSVDYTNLPESSGVLGVKRIDDGSTGGKLTLITPPFVVRFNPEGQLVARENEAIYYDGNYDGDYDTGTNRDNPQYGSGTYLPQVFNPNRNAHYDPSEAMDDDLNKLRLPFEEIQTVQSVVVYSHEAIRSAMIDEGGVDPNDAGQNWLRAAGADGEIDDAARDWILGQLDPGTPGNDVRWMLFNRYTGALMR